MMNKITIEDVLQKSPEELLNAIRKREGETLLVGPKQETSDKEAEGKPEEQSKQSKQVPGKIDVNFRKMLKGTFSPDEEFAKGHVYVREEYNFIVIGIENSSKRVRFNIYKVSAVSEVEQEILGTLSLSRETLTNSKEPFPYKKGDTVILLDNPEVKYPVVGINPASRNVVLNIFGKLRYVKISKVKLADEEVYEQPPTS